MADIIKVYTADQLYNMARDLILSKSVGITDFNDGGKTKALIQMISDIVSTVSMDFKEGLYKSIPIALYEGFGFSKKAATSATGFIRPYRKPAMVISYSGSATSVLLTITSGTIAAVCTGAPSDAFTYAFSSYPKTSDIASEIDGLTNWSCSIIKDVNCDTLYQYSGEEILGKTNYLNASGMDIMLASDIAIPVSEGYSVSIDSMQIITTAASTIPAGVSGVAIASQNTTTGLSGNIAVNAIDTENGKGYINSVVSGIEHVINDSAFSGGASAETDEERAIRFSNTVNALNAGTKNGILVAIEAIDGVKSAGMRTSYPFRGSNTIIVDDGSGSIGSTLLAEIEKVIYGDPNDLINYPGKGTEGIGYIIVAPDIVDVSVGISATRLPNVNVDLLEIKNDIQTAVEQYINTLQLGEDVLLSEIVRVGKNSNAAVYDLIVTSPSSNIAITDSQFARTGSGTGGTVTIIVTVAT